MKWESERAWKSTLARCTQEIVVEFEVIGVARELLERLGLEALTLRDLGGTMKVGYLVLYVTDPDSRLRFWTEQVGMDEKGRFQAGPFSVVQVGFADQHFAFELVPLALMKDNPDGLDLATPSIAFRVDDLASTRDALVARGVQATELGQHSGIASFAFPDNEGRWFAVISV